MFSTILDSHPSLPIQSSFPTTFSPSLCHSHNLCFPLQARTRSSLLNTLVEDLRNKTSEFLGQAEVQEAPKAEPPTTRFRDIVASLIGRKNQDGTSAPGGKKPPQTPNTLVTITPQVGDYYYHYYYYYYFTNCY